jgi:hypothetical protein
MAINSALTLDNQDGIYEKKISMSTQAGFKNGIRPTKRKSVVYMSTQAGFNPIRYVQGQVKRNPACEKKISQ